MKEKILSVCITMLGSFPNVIPFVVEFAIFTISAFGALGVGYINISYSSYNKNEMKSVGVVWENEIPLQRGID